MLGNHQARLIVLSPLGASELQISWPLRCSDRINPPIIAKSMWEDQGLGAVGERFSAGMTKQEAKMPSIRLEPRSFERQLDGFQEPRRYS